MVGSHIVVEKGGILWQEGVDSGRVAYRCLKEEYEYEYCFTSLSAQSWQYRDRRKPEAGTMPYSYFE